MKRLAEPDVWAPASRAEHAQLFCFAMFIAALGVGGNIAIHHVWMSLLDAAEFL
tara:strand:- start:478 stop:639 length:162 start_codon:yes stop_codon:yes gene_type:complete